MMLFKMHGRRTARIKIHTVARDHCKNCNSFDLDIKVYRDYYHFVLVPIVPVGDKTAKIYCNRCGEGLRTETIRRHYEEITRTPFWLYSGPIALVLIIVFIVMANFFEQKQKAAYVDHPKVGDVYGLRHNPNKFETYYFLRVNKIDGDSVYFYRNNLEYIFEPSGFDDEDFFRKEEGIVFTRQYLKSMLDSGAINSVNRGYSKQNGFQRIQ